MTEDVTILEEHVDKNCKTCKIKHMVNQLGMCAEASKLVQNKCLMCKFSKNASVIEGLHRKLGINRSLEDNWEAIG